MVAILLYNFSMDIVNFSIKKNNRTHRTIDVERPCQNSIAVASEWFDVLVGHWLCRVEVKVHFLHARQCEVHVHAATRSAGSYEPSTMFFLFFESSFYLIRVLPCRLECRYSRSNQ